MKKDLPAKNNKHVIEQILEKSRPLNYRYRSFGKRYIVFVGTKKQSQVEKIVRDFKDEGYTVTLDRRVALKRRTTRSYSTYSVIVPRKNNYQITRIVVAPPSPPDPVPPMPDPNGDKESKKDANKAW